jgi:hypothetical protein
MTMGLFSKGKSSHAKKSYRNTNVKYSRIDPATGRNKRDKGTQRATHGGPPRQIGTAKVVDRAAWRRSQKTARPVQRKSWGW